MVFAVQFWVDKNITYISSSTVCSQKLQGFFHFSFFLPHSIKGSDKWPTTSEVAPFFSYDLI